MYYQNLKNFHDFFLKMESLYASRNAVNWLDDESDAVYSRSYAQLCTDIRRAVSYLESTLGETMGIHIALLAHSCYDYIVFDFALQLCSCVAVPLNYEKSPEELAYELAHAEICYIIHDGQYMEREGSLSCFYSGHLLPITDYRSFPPAEVLPPESDPEALAMILFTSGSTGRSKGVMHCQRAILASAENNIGDSPAIRNYLGVEEGQSVGELVVAPLYHVCGHDRIFGRLNRGDVINLCQNVMLFSRSMKELDSLFLVAFPVIFETLNKYVRTGKLWRLGMLRMLASCGAPINEDVMLKLGENNFAFANGYAMTETFGSGCQNYSCDPKRIASVGPIQSHMEYRIAVDGELLLRGKSLMLGYYNDSAATAEALTPDGWLHTGDLAHVDENGYIYLTGRSKNLIILSSGENINPEELETLLLRCEDIIEAMVREQDGKLCALVYCEEVRQNAIREYIAVINRNLPRYKQINLLEFTDGPLPRTSTGKLKRI